MESLKVGCFAELEDTGRASGRLSSVESAEMELQFYHSQKLLATQFGLTEDEAAGFVEEMVVCMEGEGIK
ncbi:MAG: hypothetical protein GY751_24460 [Bacteroidetes bacterium]|nr:hypothetical protein [Bacteroidota bacterium]